MIYYIYILYIVYIYICIIYHYKHQQRIPPRATSRPLVDSRCPWLKPPLRSTAPVSWRRFLWHFYENYMDYIWILCVYIYMDLNRNIIVIIGIYYCNTI